VFYKETGDVSLHDIREVRLGSRSDVDEAGAFLHAVSLTLPSRSISLTRYMATGGQRYRKVALAIVDYLETLGYHPQCIVETPEAFND
jgi:hypothetical protein